MAILNNLKGKLTSIVFGDVTSPPSDNYTHIENLNLNKNTSTKSSSNTSIYSDKGIAVKGVGFKRGDITSKDFEDPEYDLISIQKGYDTDGYIRQGIDKYVDKIFKEGWKIYGKNVNSVQYIKTRLKYMELTTSIPNGEFIRELVESFVKYGNTMFEKVRAKQDIQLPQGLTLNGITDDKPIAGYKLINATMIKPLRDKDGTVKQWQVSTEDGDTTKKIKASNVVHFYYKREIGNAFGAPIMAPILDDVRALRQAEDDVLKMLYRNVNPLIHVMVGSKDIPGQPSDVTNFKNQAEQMDIDGGIVTTERVVIKAVPTNEIVDSSPILNYFKQRVVSGMGLSLMAFGEGDTANRSTGDNLSDDLADRITAIQDTISTFINSFMIFELLLEGGFDPIMNPDDNVFFIFNDCDINTRVKKNNDAIYQYEHNAITEDEMRELLGRDPITDRAKLYLNLITLATLNATAKVKASLDGGSKTATHNASKKETDNKQKPTNQYGTKNSPKKVTNAELEFIKKSIIKNIKKDKEIIKNKEKTLNLITNDFTYDEYTIMKIKDIINELNLYINTFNVRSTVEIVNSIEAYFYLLEIQV